ncbi:MAG: GNAT family N-acetyltransferase [Gammaproteobacteria bacterium]|nr:GNAT family N-acetyltransferase [Gammaproteobacteria bacterium]
MTGLSISTAYKIETDRLLMRCWSPEDAPKLRAALDESDQHLRPWIPWMKDEPKSIDETAAWLRVKRANFDLGKDFWFAIFDQKDLTLVGEIGLMTRAGPDAREVGYWINKSSEGKGYASEASAAVIRVAFEIDKVERIELYCAPENEPSVAIPRKMGFLHEATLAGRYIDSEGVARDSMVWTLFADAYPDSVAKSQQINVFDCMGRKIL